MIRKCFCDAKTYGQGAEYQDKEHGKNKRVFNPLKDKKGWRCTICKREQIGK